MLVLSNPSQQVVNPGETVQFTAIRVADNSGCTCCKSNTLLLGPKIMKKGNYILHVNANILSAITTAPARLAITLDGVVIPETVMEYTAPATTSVGNVSATTGIHICCCDRARIGVKNIGTGAITINPNPCLMVAKGGCN